MNITYDKAKSDKNVAERGLSFELAVGLDWKSAAFYPDNRKDYGEKRFMALSMLEDRLHAVVFTPRADSIHIISFRKANAREVTKYEQQKA